MEDESGDDQNSAQHPEHLPLEKNSLVIITDVSLLVRPEGHVCDLDKAESL